MLRWHRNEVPTLPGQLVVELPAALEPALIEDRLVQTGLGPNVSSRLLGSPCRRLGHIPHRQVLHEHERVVLADRVRGLVQVVAPEVGEGCVDTWNPGFGPLPVVAELHLAAHGTLRPAKPCRVPPEGVERVHGVAVAELGQRSIEGVT